MVKIATIRPTTMIELYATPGLAEVAKEGRQVSRAMAERQV